MAERVATGEVVIELDDKASGEMAKIGSEFEGLIDKLDREEAQVELSADVDHLKKDLKRAEKALKDFNKEDKRLNQERLNAQVTGQQDTEKRVQAVRDHAASQAERKLKAQGVRNAKIVSAARENAAKRAGDLALAGLKEQRAAEDKLFQEQQRARRETLTSEAQVAERRAAHAAERLDALKKYNAALDQSDKRVAAAQKAEEKVAASTKANDERHAARIEKLAKMQMAAAKEDQARTARATSDARSLALLQAAAAREDLGRDQAEGIRINNLIDARKKAADDEAKMIREAYSLDEKVNNKRAADRREAFRMDVKFNDARRASEEAEARRINDAIDLTARLNDAKMAAAQAEARRMNDAFDLREKARIQTIKEIDEVPKLELAFLKLQERLEEIERLRSRTNNRTAKIKYDLEIADTKRTLDNVRKEVNRRVGRDPVVIPVKYQVAAGAGAALRRAIKNPLGAADRAVTITREVNYKDVGATGAKAAAAAVNRAGNAARGAGAWFRDYASALADASVRLGPFTLGIKTAAKVMTILGPTILDVVGGLGSIVSVAGSATGGILSLGTAFVGGAIPAALGMFAVLKPVTEQFGSAMKASEAYQQALLKGNTELAAKKLTELNNVLGNVDKSTRENFKNAGKLRDTWTEATKPARAEAFKTIGAALGFADDNVKMFAQNTNNMTRETGLGLRGMMRGFDTNAFDMMSDRFNSAIQPMLGGMGHLLNYMMRVGAEAGKYLKPAMESFKGWARGLEEGAKGKGFEARIKSMMDSTKSLGKFLVSGGRLIKQFFMGGTEAGRNFLDDMTGGMDRLTKKLKEPGGMDGLKKFFSEAVAGTKALGKALAPVGAAIGTWAVEIAPAARLFFTGAGYILNFVNALLQMTALKGTVSAFIATLGALYALGKIKNMVGGISAFTAALTGLSKAQKGVAASSSAMAAGQGAAAASAGRASMASAAAAAAAGRASSVQQRPVATQRPGPAAKQPIQRVVTSGINAKEAAAVSALGAASSKAAPQVAQAAAKAGIMRTAVTGMGRAALSASMLVGGPYVAGALAAGVAAYTLYKYLSRDTTPAWAKESKAARESAEAYTNVTGRLAGTVQSHNQATAALKEANNAQRSAKKGTDDWYAAQYRAQQARAKEVTDNRAIQALSVGARMRAQQEKQQAGEKLSGYRNNVKGLREQIAAEKDAAKQAAKGGNAEGALGARQRAASLQKQLNQALQSGAGLQNQYNAAVTKQALAAANVKRQMQGLAPIIGQQAAALGKLIQQGGKSAQIGNKIAQKYTDPGDAARVAQGAANALKAGATKAQVMKIVADTSNADAALGRLNAAKINDKSLKVIASGGNEAISLLTNIAGRTLTDKEMTILETGGVGVIRMIEQITGRRLSEKEQRIVADAAGAENTIAKLSAKKLKTLSQKIDRELGKDPSDRKPETKRQMIDRLLALRNDENTPATLRQMIDRLLGSRGEQATPPSATQIVNRRIGAQVSTVVASAVQIVNQVFGRRVGKGGSAAGGAGNYVIRAADGGNMRRVPSKSSADYSDGPSARPNVRQQDRAEVTAMLGGARPTTGGKYTQPTLLVGEENRSEIVISTNPKYRDRNKEYLQVAADMLGVDAYGRKANERPERASKGKGSAAADAKRAKAAAEADAKKRKAANQKGPGGRSAGSIYDSTAANSKGVTTGPPLQRDVKFEPYAGKKKGKGKQKRRTNSAWSNYVDSLQEQQGNWEREVQIRDAAVREPREMVIEGEPKIVKDQDGKDIKVKTYVPNPKIESEYKPDILQVMNAMQVLMSIVQELMRVIPMALKANQQEESYHNAQAGYADDMVQKWDNKKTSAKTKDGRSKQRDHYKEMEDQWRDKAKESRAKAEALREDRKGLAIDYTDSAFDLREQQMAYGDYNREYIGADGSKADDAKKDAGNQSDAAVEAGQGGGGGNTSGGGAGGNTGAGVSDGLTIGQQTASMLTQNSETLKQFGQNFIGGGNDMAAQFSAGAVAAGQAAGGAFSNAASMGSAGSIMSAGGDAAASSLSGGSRKPSAANTAGINDGNSGGTVVNMVNNYATAPQDPTSFSTSVGFQVKSVL